MSKQYNIRWRRSDISKLSNVVRKVNEKIFKIEVARPDIIEYQPKMLDYKTAKESIKTRQDFNKFINSYKRYLKEGSEEVKKNKYNVATTSWDIGEFKIAQRTANAIKTRERKKVESQEVKIGGESTGITRARMGTIKQNELQPSRKNFEKMKSKKEWDMARKAMDKIIDNTERLENKEKMRENYLKGLKDAGFLGAISELEKWVRGVSIDKFLETVETDETANFLFYKEPIEWEARKENIASSWKTAFEKDKK